MVPLFVCGNVCPCRGVRSVQDVGDPGHGLVADFPRVAWRVQGPDRDAWETMPEAGQGDGVLVLSDEEFAGGCHREDLVVDVGLGTQTFEFRFRLHGQIVDGD